MLTRFVPGSFHIVNDLTALNHMLKVMSRTVSEEARLRLKWMDAFRECGNAAQVCRHFSIPLRTFWRWKKKYDPWDLASLEDRKRGPRRAPKRTPREIEQRILALKRAHPRWGKEKLSLLLRKKGVSVSGATVWRILKRHSLSVRYKTRKRKSPKPRVDWAHIRLPGDLIEVDTKYVSLNGRRLFQYTAIDVISRWRHAEVHPEQDMATCIRFLERALSSAPFKIVLVQTDNGHEFGKAVTAFLRTRNIRHVFSHKARPVENGHVERSHRTDEEEFWSVGGHGVTVEDLRRNFAAYLAMYNNERPHWGLGGKTPVEALATYSLN